MNIKHRACARQIEGVWKLWVVAPRVAVQQCCPPFAVRNLKGGKRGRHAVYR